MILYYCKKIIIIIKSENLKKKCTKTEINYKKLKSSGEADWNLRLD